MMSGFLIKLDLLMMVLNNQRLDKFYNRENSNKLSEISRRKSIGNFKIKVFSN